MRVPLYGDATDDVGAVNLVIGKGTATTGYSLIFYWGNYYLGIELNTEMVTSQWE
jgi:hypothetical protein